MTAAAPSVSRETAGAIANLLCLVRPTWDQLATLNAVHDASRTHRDLDDLVAGCIRMAQDRTLPGPAALRDGESPHWRRTLAAPSVPGLATANESCRIPGHDGYWAHNCPGCKVDQRLAAQGGDHTPSRYHREDDE